MEISLNSKLRFHWIKIEILQYYIKTDFSPFWNRYFLLMYPIFYKKNRKKSILTSVLYFSGVPLLYPLSLDDPSSALTTSSNSTSTLAVAISEASNGGAANGAPNSANNNVNGVAERNNNDAMTPAFSEGTTSASMTDMAAILSQVKPYLYHSNLYLKIMNIFLT